MKKIKFLLFVLCALNLSACITITPTGGTDIGNPDAKNSEKAPPPEAPPATHTLLSEACSTLNFCLSGFPKETCQTNGMQSPHVGKFLGTSTLHTDTLEKIHSALERGLIRLNTAELAKCRAAIRARSCSDLPLDEIWQRQRSLNFSKFYKFWESLKADCQEVFK
jgi:hypothetical protein